MKTRLTLQSAATGIAVAIASGASAQGNDDRFFDYHHMWDVGGWMFLGPLWMIVVVGVIVAVVVLLVRWLGGVSQPGIPYPPARTPMDILKERLARGEIDRDEFEERRKLVE